MKTLRFAVLVSMVVASAVAVVAQETHQYPGTDPLLVNRWRWAMAEASRSGARDFWIGYSIKRLMDADSYIFSDNIISGRGGTRTSLYSILRIPNPSGSDSVSGLRANEGTGIVKRLKDVALLFHYLKPPAGEPSIPAQCRAASRQEIRRDRTARRGPHKAS